MAASAPPAPASASGSPDTAAVLADWRAAESAVRSRAIPFGLATREQVAHRTGLETMQAMLVGELPPPFICETLDFILVEVAFGRAVFQGTPLRRHYNPLGTVHGGWFAALLDSCLGCAVHTTMPVGRAYTTAEFKVNLVRPLTDRVPLVRAEGTVVHGGRRMATAEGRLVGADGRLYAHASTTCFVFDAGDAPG